MFKGISKRWLINTFGVVSAIVVLLIIFISVAVHSLCYSTVENELLNQTKKLNDIFPNGISESAETFESRASAYATDFSDKDEMEVQILNASGRVITTSAGFGAETENIPDYVQAQSSENGFGRYKGRSNSGEKIMAETYDKRAEENLLAMKKEVEEKNRQMLRTEYLIAFPTVISGLALVFIASFIEMPVWLRILLIVLAFVMILTIAFIAVGIEQKAGYYECQHCRHRYVPTYRQVNLAMHMGRTRYMKCPECGKYSWQKKVLGKEDDQDEKRRQ